MPLFNLGNLPLNNIYENVSYTPLPLVSGSFYSLGLRFQSDSPELLYSYFLLRCINTATIPGTFYTPINRQVFYSPGIQLLDFRITPNLTLVGDTTIQVARIPIFKNPSNLATVDLELLLNTDFSY